MSQESGPISWVPDTVSSGPLLTYSQDPHAWETSTKKTRVSWGY